jgi:outer membrane protein TolC
LVDAAEYRPLASVTQQTATAQALQDRADLRSAQASVRSAQYSVRAEKAQRLPAFSLNADYGGAGVNVGSFNSVYTVAGSISFPIYTGGRIRADVDGAQANFAAGRRSTKTWKGASPTTSASPGWIFRLPIQE